jgi:ABC-type transporter MlaC component
MVHSIVPHGIGYVRTTWLVPAACTIRKYEDHSLKLAFRLHARQDEPFVLTDMQFEGIWLALSEREEFTAFLQQHSGDIASLTDSLRSKTQGTSAGAARGSRPG